MEKKPGNIPNTGFSHTIFRMTQIKTKYKYNN